MQILELTYIMYNHAPVFGLWLLANGRPQISEEYLCKKIVGFGIKPATDWQSGNFMATGNCRTRLFSSF